MHNRYFPKSRLDETIEETDLAGPIQKHGLSMVGNFVNAVIGNVNDRNPGLGIGFDINIINAETKTAITLYFQGG